MGGAGGDAASLELTEISTIPKIGVKSASNQSDEAGLNPSRTKPLRKKIYCCVAEIPAIPTFLLMDGKILFYVDKCGR